MTEFETRYRNLNAQQKKAVDTLEGPVMVVAGPGTGKTELLSVRAANILAATDTSPRNILCLTYTESGATAMRERLSQLIGPNAYKVAVHTFHSFGAEIINRYTQYFYQGAHFRPADELSTYEVLTSIFDTLPANSVLAGRMNGTYTHLRDAQTAISDLKKSGLTPGELLAVIEHNEAFTSWVQPSLNDTFGPRLSKSRLSAIEAFTRRIDSYPEEPLDLITYKPLAGLLQQSLGRALDHARETDSTKPISEWKRRWLTKDDDGALVLKDAVRAIKLREIAGIYERYLHDMQERSLFDFDDMILRVVHGLELFNDLAYELQEQYQYIMVDEFQDTNDAQMRLVWNLTNSPVLEGRPNLLVVGDDDQAIYRFQGATLSNILDFTRLYRDVAVIPLIDNYRSCGEVLELARSVITQAEERLETTLDGLDKSLVAHYAPTQRTIDYRQFSSSDDEFAAIASELAHSLKTRPDASRAIIARRHHQLQSMLPYLQAHDLPLLYEREENILELDSIVILETLARVVHLLAQQRHQEADALLPELLAHPAWSIATEDLWDLALSAQRLRQSWLDTMQARTDKLADIARWLIESQRRSLHTPLEPMLDWLFGTTPIAANETEQSEAGEEEPFADQASSFVSPLKQHFFPAEQLTDHPSTYLHHLNALRTLRQKIREYRPDRILDLDDFITFLDLHHELNLSIRGTEQIGDPKAAIQLLSAHSAKGLEFDEVYIIGLTDHTWGETARSRARLISFPHNLPLGFDSDTSDERLRLLYVALTRAKSALHLSSYSFQENGRGALPVGYLETGLLAPEQVSAEADLHRRIDRHEQTWQSAYFELAPATMQQMLAARLERYRLSSTHLTNYLDVSRGGPELFLQHNLLLFPQAMTASSAYGSAIHTALQRAHNHLTATGEHKPVEDIIGQFTEELQRCQLDHTEFERYRQRGSEALQVFLGSKQAEFTPLQQAEVDFATEDIRLHDARLTGKIDVIAVDKAARTVTVTDYKTGKPVRDWRGRTEYEKIKLHHYRQQLLFYKLLIEHSRTFAGYTVTKGVIQFVEPDKSGAIHCLELDYEPESLADFTSLVCAVWARIKALDFTLTDEYEPKLSGIRQFEEYLRDSNTSDILTQ